jgi:hypothetical protein
LASTRSFVETADAEIERQRRFQRPLANASIEPLRDVDDRIGRADALT